MEISEQTQNELKEIEMQKYAEWNKKINELAKDIVDLLSKNQVSFHDSVEIIKIVNQVIGTKVGSLNLNFILNQEDDTSSK